MSWPLPFMYFKIWFSRSFNYPSCKNNHLEPTSRTKVIKFFVREERELVFWSQPCPGSRDRRVCLQCVPTLLLCGASSYPPVQRRCSAWPGCPPPGFEPSPGLWCSTSLLQRNGFLWCPRKQKFVHPLFIRSFIQCIESLLRATYYSRCQI